MKKFIPHILAIVLLSGLAAFFFFKQNESTLHPREADFKVKNPEAIKKIILRDEQKRTIVLEKKKSVWQVNNKYIAREDLIQHLLNILAKMESQAPVGKAAHENVLREMLNRNIRVQIFTGGTQPQKVFYVGGPTLDGRGTYMILEIDGKPAERPHVVKVPGIDAYLTPAFEMDEEVWRSRKAFSVSPYELAQVSVQYPASPMQSFTISAAGDSFELCNALGEKEYAHPSILYTYCAMYESIYFEAFDNKNSERNLITQEPPFAIITVKEKNGNTTEVKLYYMPINRRSKRLFDEQGNELLADVDRFFALHNNTDFAIAQVYVFGKLLRKYQDFFPQKDS
jgi:hypothetical protein